jgi:adhesin transport system membrane fusion protein
LATPFSRTTQALSADHSWAFWVSSVVAGALLAAWMGWFWLGDVAVKEVSRQARIEVGQSAHAVSPAVSGNVTENHLRLGQLVRQGDVLLQIDASAEVLKLQESQVQWTGMAPQMDSLKKEIDALTKASGADQQTAKAAAEAASARAQEASTAADQARDNAWRIKEQGRSGFVSDAAAQRAQADAQRLSSTRDAASADSRRVQREAMTRTHQNIARIESLQREWFTLQGQQQSLQATMVRLQREIAQRTVRAPISGVVGDIAALPPGSQAEQGKPVATIVPAGQLRIVGQFMPASALGHIRPGQHARMRLDGFAWTQFGDIPAVVQSVGTEIHEGMVRVELSPVGTQATQLPLQHGLPGSVDIVIERCAPASLLLRTVGQWLQAGSKP